MAVITATGVHSAGGETVLSRVVDGEPFQPRCLIILAALIPYCLVTSGGVITEAGDVGHSCTPTTCLPPTTLPLPPHLSVYATTTTPTAFLPVLLLPGWEDDKQEVVDIFNYV